MAYKELDPSRVIVDPEDYGQVKSYTIQNIMYKACSLSEDDMNCICSVPETW